MKRRHCCAHGTQVEAIHWKAMKALKTNSSFSARCRIPSVHSCFAWGPPPLPASLETAHPRHYYKALNIAPSLRHKHGLHRTSAASLAQPQPRPTGQPSLLLPRPRPARTAASEWPRSCVPEAALLTSRAAAAPGPGRLACTPPRTCLSTRSARGGRTGAALSALQERCFPRDRRLSRDGPQDSPLPWQSNSVHHATFG